MPLSLIRGPPGTLSRSVGQEHSLDSARPEPLVDNRAGARMQAEQATTSSADEIRVCLPAPFATARSTPTLAGRWDADGCALYVKPADLGHTEVVATHQRADETTADLVAQEFDVFRATFVPVLIRCACLALPAPAA